MRPEDIVKMTRAELDAHTADAIEKKMKSQSGNMRFLMGGGLAKASKGYDLETSEGRGLAWARAVRCLAIANNNYDAAVDIAKSWLEVRRFDSDEAVIVVLKSNALNPSNLTEGGIFITPDQYGEMIMLLTANTVVRKMKGVQFESMTSGILDVDYELTRPVAEWIGENQEQNATEPTYAQHRMIAKTLMATSAVKNTLLDRADAGTSVDKKVLESMQTSIGNAEDLAFLLGLGTTPYAPKGLMGWIDPANKFDSHGHATVAAVKGDMSELIDLVEGADVHIENGNYIMNNHNKSFLGDVSTTTDISVFPQLSDNPPVLKSYPVWVTSTMPNANVMFVDSSKIIIGDTKNVEITTSKEASYMRNNVLVSAFSRRETVFQVQLQTDMFLTYPKAASLMEATSY